MDVKMNRTNTNQNSNNACRVMSIPIHIMFGLTTMSMYCPEDSGVFNMSILDFGNKHV